MAQPETVSKTDPLSHGFLVTPASWVDPPEQDILQKNTPAGTCSGYQAGGADHLSPSAVSQSPRFSGSLRER
jgi:hypothetical protein